MQDSLWEFDKGGYLQDVLHHLKYSGVSELGRVLGRKLSLKLRKNPFFDLDEEVLLLPVPLHPSRQRKRGYNQSAMIAEGISKATGAEIVDQSAIKRIKNTRTQTGLSSASRKNNIAGAFQLAKPEVFQSGRVLIIDDVITTGATMLELAGVVRPLCDHIGLATVARA
ncbi:ComF family protein [Natronogracilivirga saccharolytica]|uniref:ComF family protein n=1 Tax=Natronogracilivirga saccharolytica TaxID=2812953 RepID=A0A8J7RNR8_9BACT|nr:ComF family protein [Natronogracilivirga saccharolytica]MBP3191054.1 ComF family protein [Natronogracilivirga saccharolytica]